MAAMVRQSFVFLAIISFAGCAKSDLNERIRTVAADEPLGEKSAQETSPAEAEEPLTKGLLKLPRDGGIRPWPVGSINNPPHANGVRLTDFVIRGRDIWSAVVNHKAGRAVVILNDWVDKKKPSFSRVLLCDIFGDRVLHQWEVDRLYCPFGLSDDGKKLLMRRFDYSNMDQQAIELWTMAGNSLTRRSLYPYWAGWSAEGEHRGKPDAPNHNRPDATVRWANFVGSDHFVTVTGCGELKVWTLNAFQQVGVFPNVIGLPDVTPDGAKVAFATNEEVALLDPTVGQIIGVHRIGKPPADAVLAFEPTGNRLAIGGTGRATILDLRNGGFWDAMITEMRVEAKRFLPDFGWAGECLYHAGNLYDLRTPIPIWSYTGAKWASPQGHVVWTVVQALGEKEVALRPFALPHPGVQAGINAALNTPGLFTLRPGDSVSVDVSGLVNANQMEIRKTLERRLRELGFQLKAGADVVFQASEEKTGVIDKVTYHIGGTTRTFTYSKRHAELKAAKNGRVIWQNRSYDAPPFIMTFHGGIPDSGFMPSLGGPNYKIFTHCPLPGVIRADGNKSALGSSILSTAGIRDRAR